MPTYFDARADLKDLLIELKTQVERGSVRPRYAVRTTGQSILLSASNWDELLELRRDLSSGVLWVMLRNRGGVVDQWTQFEIEGTIVQDLWNSCRDQLNSSDVEDNLANLAKWLRERARA